MKTRFVEDDFANETPSEESDTPDAVWTLDDLDQSTDLTSVRSAYVHVDASH